MFLTPTPDTKETIKSWERSNILHILGSLVAKIVVRDRHTDHIYTEPLRHNTYVYKLLRLTTKTIYTPVTAIRKKQIRLPDGAVRGSHVNIHHLDTPRTSLYIYSIWLTHCTSIINITQVNCVLYIYH